MKYLNFEKRLKAIEVLLGIPEDTLKLPVPGKWYRIHGNNNLVYVLSIVGENHVKGWGFGGGDKWYDDSIPWLIMGSFSEASFEEVQEALVKEALRRGYKADISCAFGNQKQVRKLSGGTPYLTQDNSGNPKNLCINNDIIFSSSTGKWAEVIDEFADLKEAHKNGEIIQYKIKGGEWTDTVNNTPGWYTENEYRIKPQEKPQVGDVCKFWDEHSPGFVVSTLEEIAFNGKRFITSDGVGYSEAKRLTKVEVLKLLFGKEDK